MSSQDEFHEKKCYNRDQNQKLRRKMPTELFFNGAVNLNLFHKIECTFKSFL